MNRIYEDEPITKTGTKAPFDKADIPPIRVTDRRGQNRQPEYMERVAETLKKVAKPLNQKTLFEMQEDCFMHPGPGRVIVQPDQFVYKGMVAIPKSAEKKGTTGIILYVGFGCEAQFFIKNEGIFRALRPGDRIAYGMWTGIEYLFDQRPSYRVLMETEISSVLTDKATELLNVEA